MLAKVHQFPTLAEDPSTQSIKVVFDPSASLGSQFTFKSSTGKRYLMVDVPTTISVTLTGGATFPSVPVVWQNCPSNGAPAVIMSEDCKTISFLVPAPTHYFIPWFFALNVNFGTVNNIMSPPFFLVRPLGDLAFILDYKAADGSFTFLREDAQADIILDGQQILLNVIPDTFFTVVLKEPSFNKIPIVWRNGQQPSWIKVTADPDNNSLDFSLGESAQGQFAGFQFAIDLPDGRGGEITILSPDPILINATIGDG